MSDLEIVIERLNFARISSEMIAQIDAVTAESANAVLADAVLRIANPPKTGRVYRHGKVEHQASAPGESPAVDTGALMNSVIMNRRGTADYEVIFSAEYAKPLEFGTPHILPRPFVRPAIARERPRYKSALRARLRRAR